MLFDETYSDAIFTDLVSIRFVHNQYYGDREREIRYLFTVCFVKMENEVKK